MQGKEDHIVRGIKDGSYTAYSTLGHDWDAERGTFTRDCGFGRRFSRPLDVDTVFGSTSIRYTTWTLTLGPNIGGGGSVGIPPDRFPT